MTLVGVWVIADLVHAALKSSRDHWLPWLCAVALLTYQAMLSLPNPTGEDASGQSYASLTNYIIAAPRNGNGAGFFAANREGVLSLCGFVPMYLLVEWFSNRVFFLMEPSGPGATTSGNGVIAAAMGTAAGESVHGAGELALDLGSNECNTNDFETKEAHNNTTRDRHINNNMHAVGDNHSSSSSFTNGLEKESYVIEQTSDFEAGSFYSFNSNSNSSNGVKSMMGSLLYFLPKQQYRAVMQLSHASLVLWLLWLFSSRYIQPTSRRLTNLTYILLILALAASIMSLIIIADAAG